MMIADMIQNILEITWDQTSCVVKIVLYVAMLKGYLCYKTILCHKAVLDA